MSKKSTINFTVSLDENHIPEKIEWSATDGGTDGTKEAKAVMLSLWDSQENNTMRIDLWTKDMMVDDMKHFFFQSFLTMSDTFERATSDKETADEIRAFVKQLGQKFSNNK